MVGLFHFGEALEDLQRVFALGLTTWHVAWATSYQVPLRACLVMDKSNGAAFFSRCQEALSQDDGLEAGQAPETSEATPRTASVEIWKTDPVELQAFQAEGSKVTT